MRSDERSMFGIIVCVNVCPSFDRNQLTKSLAAFGCGALAKAEMQHPDPPARIRPTFFGQPFLLDGQTFLRQT